MRWRRLPVEDTPLGQSLDGKVERGALKLLDEHSASMPTGERAAQVAPTRCLRSRPAQSWEGT
jgi:hypothetical protein